MPVSLAIRTVSEDCPAREMILLWLPHAAKKKSLPNTTVEHTRAASKPDSVTSLLRQRGQNVDQEIERWTALASMFCGGVG